MINNISPNKNSIYSSPPPPSFTALLRFKEGFKAPLKHYIDTFAKGNEGVLPLYVDDGKFMMERFVSSLKKEFARLTPNLKGFYDLEHFDIKHGVATARLSSSDGKTSFEFNPTHLFKPVEPLAKNHKPAKFKFERAKVYSLRANIQDVLTDMQNWNKSPKHQQEITEKYQTNFIPYKA